jgi:hypothetical protein
MRIRIKASATAMLAILTLSGCDLLDVNNPNNLVEESIRSEAAASAVVNGGLALTASAISQIWQPYLVASDEMFWIGSRDAWLSLDQGYISDPNNEFTDAAFPSLGQARWMTDEAVEILTEHAANDPSFSGELARANLYAGMIHMIIGEVQDDFAFSDKTEDGPPVGPDGMAAILDEAISHLDAAVSNAPSDDIRMRALALRARTKQSRAIWDRINPMASGSNGLVNSASAGSDALEVISMAGGVTADWDYTLTYSASTVGNSIADWVNDRKENQFDPSLVNLDAANDIVSVAITDPIDGTPDAGFTNRLEQWKEGPVDTKGGSYPPMTVASTRLMHLILAENALATGDNAGFTTHINHVRAMDGDTPYSGQIPAEEMLMHERRTNLAIMGLRLADMYRFGIQDPRWQSGGDAISAPGTMLPITIIEIRANCNLNGLGC